MQKYNYVFISLSFLFSLSLFGQGTQVEFGKNRVQYHRDFDEWSQYESENFITYWYGEGRNIGQAVVQLAEYDFNSIQSILEHRINDKIEIIVYTDITDIKQSNIGSEETFNNTGGQTKIVGNKVFVFFDGNHNNLRYQIREGIASIYLNAMLFGSNLQEIVQNAVMMNLPEWFKQGLVGFVGQEWNTELDNQLKDIVLSKKFEGFDRLAEENPRLAGHSLWYFISENYGQSTVSNLLYLTRINRSVDSGFLYVLGSTYDHTTDSWALFFKQRYKADEDTRTKPERRRIEIKNKRNLPISQLKLSPDGTKIAYVTNEIGKYKVYLHDLKSKDRSVVLKEGFRNAFQATDYNYPLISWSPTNTEIAILYEKRDVPKLMVYDLTTQKEKVEDLSTQFQRVYSMDFVSPITLVFSATVRGYSDIFLYSINTRQTERITQDFYDDLDASYVNVRHRKGILFSSNRTDTLLRKEKLDTILPINSFDIFYYDLETKSKELVRVTNTPVANERQPVAIDTAFFSYLSDQSGIYNREVGYLEEYIHHFDQIIFLDDGTEIRLHIDSSLASLDTSRIDTIVIQPIIKERAITHAISNYDRNIIEQHTAPRVNRVVELVYRGGEYQIYSRKINTDTVMLPPTTVFQDSRVVLVPVRGPAPEPPKETGPNYETPKVDIITENDNMLKEVPKEEETNVAETKVEEAARDTAKIDIDNYLFQSEFDDEEIPTTVVTIEEETIEEEEAEVETTLNNNELLRRYNELTTRFSNNLEDVYKFRPGRIVPYRLKFRTDYVTTQLDNSLLFDGWDVFTEQNSTITATNPGTTNSVPFEYPPPGILLKANFKDLFEDYEFIGGIRIPTTFNGAEYFLIFNDKKKRLDKQYAVYRKNTRYSMENGTSVPNRSEANVLLGQYSLRYPLDIFRSLRVTAKIRRDRSVQLATDLAAFNRPTRSVQRAGLKLEYVFDNTLDVALNIKNGSRYKIYTEFFKSFDVEVLDGFSLSFDDGFLGVVGVDARHYQRILKHSVFATRFAGASSFGSQRISYFLGGVDNWLFPLYNEEIPVGASPDYEVAYNTLASNMRGFRINIRNGNSYALANAELRMPVFKYISKRIRSSFFRNFQVVGFFDVGTAWSGLSPFSDDNPLNTTFIGNGELVSVKVNYFRDPVVAGYGFGVRSVLFGYFLRLDYAWGIETRRVQDPRIYVSLGMDF